MRQKYTVTFTLIFLCFVSFYLQAKNSCPTLLKDGYHFLKSKTPDGSIIELEDGSYFKIYPSDTAIIEEWEENTILTISPAYWSRYASFYITNTENKYYVRADYEHPPFPDHPMTYVISHIDPYYGEIELKDGSSKIWWEVDERDLPLIDTWSKGDLIVVGINTKWFAYYYKLPKNILLNYSKKEVSKYVNVKRTA